jgi:hypothetical protein
VKVRLTDRVESSVSETRLTEKVRVTMWDSEARVTDHDDESVTVSHDVIDKVAELEPVQPKEMVCEGDEGMRKVAV